MLTEIPLGLRSWQVSFLNVTYDTWKRKCESHTNLLLPLVHLNQNINVYSWGGDWGGSVKSISAGQKKLSCSKYSYTALYFQWILKGNWTILENLEFSLDSIPGLPGVFLFNMCSKFSGSKCYFSPQWRITLKSKQLSLLFLQGQIRPITLHNLNPAEC